MNSSQLPDPTTVEQLLAALNRYPFATQLVLVLAGLVVLGLYLKRKRE